MRLRTRIVRLGRGSGDELRECRICGTTLDGDVENCPECGYGEIAVYRFESTSVRG